VQEFYERIVRAAQPLTGEFEIVFVNDGSPDDAFARVLELQRADPRVVGVDLSRNFGHHKAMMTGLAHARGAQVFLLDSDLEEDPEWLAPFAEQMAREGCDVVYGVQRARKGGAFERWSGRWFYRAFGLLTGLPLPSDVATARLMSRRYVDALLLHDEREVFIAGLWHITGFDQRGRPVDKHSRSGSTYTLRRKLALLVNSVTSFSNAPLIAIFYIGVAISLVAGGYTVYLVMNWWLFSHPLSGWTSVMASIWLIGGLVISFIGVIGIYLSKIFSEAKRRPYTIVRHVYGRRDG
jgi:putative glycosyltransferase